MENIIFHFDGYYSSQDMGVTGRVLHKMTPRLNKSGPQRSGDTAGSVPLSCPS